MSVVSEVKETIIEAKKKYDKDKYIEILEEQITKVQNELERTNTKMSLLEDNTFVLNSDHMELFKYFRNNNYSYSEKEIRDISKKDINLEIALSELIKNEYFKYPCAIGIDSEVYLYIPEDKKITFLSALKKMNNN